MNKNSLYIHIPFCQKKCLFCSFVITVGQEHRIECYLDALEFEMKMHHKKNIETIYIGGGTPTMLHPDHLIRLFEMMHHFFNVDPDAEITVEANPEGLTKDRLRALKKTGVNRLSIGIQSMDDRYLSFLGRCHDRITAQTAVQEAKAFGFDNINVDLMYSFPGQTQEEIINDVVAITALGSQHISLYSLTIEEQSRFYAEGLSLDDSEKLAQEYALILDLLAERGYQQYEVSNFAKQGARAQHNQRYWTGQQYIGLGMGAHGFEKRKRYWNVSRLQDYLKCASEKRSMIDGQEQLTSEQHLYERLVFGLRMNEGVSLTMIQDEVGCDLSNEQQKMIGLLIEEGLLRVDQDRLCTTRKGLFVLDDLAVKLCC